MEFAWASAVPAASTPSTSSRSRHIAAGRRRGRAGAPRRVGVLPPGRPRAPLARRPAPPGALFRPDGRARARPALRARASCRGSRAGGALALRFVSFLFILFYFIF